MPISKGEIIPLRINNTYVLIIYAKKGIYRCKVLVKGRFKKGLIEMAKVELVTSLVKFQRREFFRFQCVISLKISKEDDWSEGITKDIGGGGIRLISNSEFEAGDEILLKLVLDQREMLILGSILTKEDSNVELYKYQYRVIFQSISKTDQDHIIQYLFTQQRKQVRQDKGL